MVIIRRRSTTAAIGMVLFTGLVSPDRAGSVAGTYPVVWAQGPYPYQVMIDRGDGNGPVVLTQGRGAVLSPDGQQVTVIRGQDLWVARVDGSEEHLALSQQAYNEYIGSPTDNSLLMGEWAPDGATILCSYCSGLSVCDLMQVGPDGSGLRRLAGIGLDRSAWPSAFSQDAQRLLLGSNSDNSPTLYVLNLADLSAVTLTQMAETGSWSPDGSMVAFAWSSGLRGYGLEVVGVDGANRRDVAAAVRAATGRRFEPTGVVTWSADGREIAVQDHSDGLYYAMQLDGSGLRPVAELFEPYACSPPTGVRSTSWAEAKGSAR